MSVPVFVLVYFLNWGRRGGLAVPESRRTITRPSVLTPSTRPAPPLPCSSTRSPCRPPAIEGQLSWLADAISSWRVEKDMDKLTGVIGGVAN